MVNRNETKVKVRFIECDYYQHVNNTVYLTYMDINLADLLRQIWPDLKKASFLLLNVHTSIDFLKPSTFDDDLLVIGKIKNIGKSSITFEYEIQKEGEIIVKAEKVYVALDQNEKKVPIPQELRNIYQG